MKCERSFPKIRRLVSSPRLLTLAILVTMGACVSGADQSDETVAVGHYELSGERHEQTTAAGAFGWVDDWTQRQMVHFCTIGDTDPVWRGHSETHFDNCYWNEGRDFVISNRNAAIQYAIDYEATRKPKDRRSFFESMGFVMHATQDFYAHSNWVETHDPGVLANFNEPGAPMPEGWYSGTYPNARDTGPDAGAAHCPPGTPTHAEMNKDGPGGLANDEAFFDATLATTDQMIRLIAGIRAVAGADTAEGVLSAIGFVNPTPTHTVNRTDYTRSVELVGGPLGLTTPMLFCEPGSYVAAFAQLVDPQHNGDNTDLNTVLFHCKDRSGAWTAPLIAWAGVWGKWSEVSACPAIDAFVSRGELKIDPAHDSGDDTGANAARFACDDGSMLVADNDGPLGSWTGAAGCPSGEAVCGAQIQYQAPQGDGDDTAMNGLTLLCCALPE